MVAPVRWATPAKEVLWQCQPLRSATSINQLVSTPPPSPPKAAISMFRVLADCLCTSLTMPPLAAASDRGDATNCGHGVEFPSPHDRLHWGCATNPLG